MQYILFLLMVICVGIQHSSGQPAQAPTVYDIFVRMMKDAKILDPDLPNQYIAALMISEEEAKSFDPSKPINDQYKGRFKPYKNTEDHGEVILLSELDTVFFPNYTDESVPLLLLYSTHIPCFRDESASKTHCSQKLTDDIQIRQEDPQKRTYTLVTAFISVYSRMVRKPKGGTRYDITNVIGSLEKLTSRPSQIRVAYFMSKDSNNLLTNAQNPQDLIVASPNDYMLSNWLNDDLNSHDNKRLICRFPQCSPNMFVQDALYMCLDVFLGGCPCLSHAVHENDPEPVLRYAVDWAMKSCFHGVNAKCKRVRNPLHGSKNSRLRRATIYKCLYDNWISKLHDIKCNECKGSDRDLVGMCVTQSISAQKVGCPDPTNNQHGWVDCGGSLDSNYGHTRISSPPPSYVRCRIPGSVPQFLCQAAKPELSQPPLKKRRVEKIRR